MKIGKHASYHLYNSCLRKTSHASQPEAEAALTALLKAGTDSKLGRLHAYQCDFAPHWHIGHSTRTGVI